MDLARPLQGLLPAVDSDVVVVLARSSAPRTGREIARLAERSHPAVQRVLDRFVEHGLVYREPAGRSRVYTLNRAHLAALPLEALADLRTELFNRLRGSIEAWELAPVHASVFGSAARGEGGPESDLDLFIVRPTEVAAEDQAWRAQLDGLVSDVREWTGNHAGIAEVAEQDLATLVREERPVLGEVKADAAVLAGVSARRLLSDS